jgi:hypothetical protein
MTVRSYECEERTRCDEGADFTSLDARSDDNVLLRVITGPETKSEAVGVDGVGKMCETMKQEHYDKGVLIRKRFTESAKKEMSRKDIQMVSVNHTPRFKPDKLYLKIQNCIDDLCRAKCGRVPEKESDCEGKDSDGNYSCKIRLISDNASFHFERGWTSFLKRDLMRLFAVVNSLNDRNKGD